MQSILQSILAFLAKLYLARFRPRIVAITGSVGKTSAKEAITTVLGVKYRVRASQGNYNNEIGVPLAILGYESAGKNVLSWVLIFIKSLVKLFVSNYPKILILELGADKPGDINYLVNLLGPIDVGVITYIGNSHMEFFSSPDALAKEKLVLIKKLAPTAYAILNFDSPKVYEGRGSTKAEVIGYGMEPKANLMASDLSLIRSEGSWGLNFKVHYGGNVVPFFIPNALGKPTVSAVLAAVGVAQKFDLNILQASEALKKYSPPAGRLRLIPGIKRTVIIDDTYNAAPASTAAALEVLSQIADGRKIAVIGGMAELGAENESGHREVAVNILEAGVALVFLVGMNGKIIQDELENRKYSGKIFWYSSSKEAAIPVQNILQEGDTVLVKGSQSARMEIVVLEIMADPLQAEKLLVRQTGKWKNSM